MFQKKWMASLAVAAWALMGVPTPSAEASPTNTYYSWQIWGYVDMYREKANGNVVVWFENSAGTQITHYPNSSGTNQCPSNPGLEIHKSHPSFEQLAKTSLTAGLARRKVKVAYEATSGTCYIKQILVEM